MARKRSWTVLAFAVVSSVLAPPALTGAVPTCIHRAAVCGGVYEADADCTNSSFDNVAVYDIYLRAGTTVHLAAAGDQVAHGFAAPAGVGLYDPAGDFLDGTYPAYTGIIVTVAETGLYSIGVSSTSVGYGLLVECTGGPTGCTPTDNTLCLNQGRFSVTTTWQTENAASSGTAVRLTDESGYFWFFDPDNIEVVTKVLDACASSFESFWVFAAGLTNVGVTTTVTDTVSGSVKVYRNERGNPFSPVQDTSAFATCP